MSAEDFIPSANEIAREFFTCHILHTLKKIGTVSLAIRRAYRCDTL